ncbi:MAG: DUF1858 domain-containing protein [Ignavibacteriales bacterium]|nr:DUF1858 domain-containing protein [Ignavibacteriaceae bacterium]NLH59873.1 DUF1858 domain-containing protein [Ignavibacteriales bacterium]HPO56999.1 DUF1858 domain-containing protein [Ignavibacteriaceae bacterium]
MISREMTIEDLVNEYPDSVTFLMKRGIRCLRCGEPSWGSIESAAREKNFSEDEITQIVDEMNEMLVKNKK